MSENDNSGSDVIVTQDPVTGKVTFKSKVKKLKEKAEKHTTSLAIVFVAIVLILVSLYYFFSVEDNMMGGGFLVSGLIAGGLAYYMYTKENEKNEDGDSVDGGAKKAKKEAKKAAKKGHGK